MFILVQLVSSHETSTSQSKCPMLQQIALSLMAKKCSGRRISQHPVAVTKMDALGAASSIVVTSKPGNISPLKNSKQRKT